MEQMRRLLIPAMLTAAVMSAVDMSAKSFDQIHVKGSCELKLVYHPDSAGIVRVPSGGAVETARVGTAVFITAAAATSSTSRVPVTLYADGPVSLVDASGRAIVTADSIVAADQLSLVSSGAAALKLGAVAAANVNVSLSGSGSITIGGHLAATTVNMSLTGSGAIKADAITVSRMTVTQRGSGKMGFAGSARDCAVVGRGSGSVDLRNLVAGTMDLKLFGAGRIFYPAGVRVSLDGNIERIIQVKPYQPL